MKKVVLLLGCLLLVLAGCSKVEKDHKSVTVHIAPEWVTCTGITQQNCMKVRFVKDQPWVLFYGKIKGFNYQPGYYYTLEVKQQHTKQENPLVSRMAWKLVKVVKRTKATEADKVKAAAEKADKKSDKPTSSNTPK